MQFILTRFNRDAANEPIPVEETLYQEQSLQHMLQKMAINYGLTKTVITRVDESNKHIGFFVADEEQYANSTFEVSLYE